MRVSFDGETYDPDEDDERLRNACAAKARRVVSRMPDNELRPALEDLVGSASLLAVKAGAVAAIHHAYRAPVAYEIIDVLALSMNRMVGLLYTPPEQVIQGPQLEGADSAEENIKD